MENQFFFQNQYTGRTLLDFEKEIECEEAKNSELKGLGFRDSDCHYLKFNFMFWKSGETWFMCLNCWLVCILKHPWLVGGLTETDLEDFLRRWNAFKTILTRHEKLTITKTTTTYQKCQMRELVIEFIAVNSSLKHDSTSLTTQAQRELSLSTGGKSWKTPEGFHPKVLSCSQRCLQSFVFFTKIIFELVFSSLNFLAVMSLFELEDILKLNLDGKGAQKLWVGLKLWVDDKRQMDWSIASNDYIRGMVSWDEECRISF